MHPAVFCSRVGSLANFHWPLSNLNTPVLFHLLLRGTMLYLRCMHHVRLNVLDPIQCADSIGEHARTIDVSLS